MIPTLTTLAATAFALGTGASADVSPHAASTRVTQEQIAALSDLLSADAHFRQQFFSDPSRASYDYLRIVLSPGEREEIERAKERLVKAGEATDENLSIAAVKPYSATDRGGGKDKRKDR